MNWGGRLEVLVLASSMATFSIACGDDNATDADGEGGSPTTSSPTTTGPSTTTSGMGGDNGTLIWIDELGRHRPKLLALDGADNVAGVMDAHGPLSLGDTEITPPEPPTGSAFVTLDGNGKPGVGRWISGVRSLAPVDDETWVLAGFGVSGKAFDPSAQSGLGVITVTQDGSLGKQLPVGARIDSVANAPNGHWMVVGAVAMPGTIGGVEVGTSSTESVFAAELTADNTAAWLIEIPSPSGTNVDLNGVAVSPDGFTAVVGNLDGALEVGDESLLGDKDGLAFVVSPSGEVQWAKTFGDGLDPKNGERFNDVTSDKNANFVVIGSIDSEQSLGGEVLPIYDPEFGGADNGVVLVLDDASGGHLGSRTFGEGKGLVEVEDIALASKGELVLSGSLGNQTAKFDRPLQGPGIFAVRLDEELQIVWSWNAVSLDQYEAHTELEVASNDDLVLFGWCGGRIDIAGHVTEEKAAFMARLRR